MHRQKKHLQKVSLKLCSEGLGEWVSDDKTDTKTLYAVAKAFIKAVQEAM